MYILGALNNSDLPIHLTHNTLLLRLHTTHKTHSVTNTGHHRSRTNVIKRFLFLLLQGKSGSPLLLRRDNAHIPSGALIGGSTLGKFLPKTSFEMKPL